MDIQPIAQITAQELADLTLAKSLLENPGLTARLASLVGEPMEKGFSFLPKGWPEKVREATQTALMKALEGAVSTLDPRNPQRSSELFHKVLVGASGVVGGALGLAALPIELPISTTIMLRSIADIARSEGHDLNSLEVKLSCLEVFALGSGTVKLPASAEVAAAPQDYWSTRDALGSPLSEAVAYLGTRSALKTSAPPLIKLVAVIASRFGVLVSQQIAAKAIPVVGAVGGSIINVLFIDHFQEMARGHFTVKRLEARYGAAAVRQIYGTLAIPSSKLPPPPVPPAPVAAPDPPAPTAQPTPPPPPPETTAP